MKSPAQILSLARDKTRQFVRRNLAPYGREALRGLRESYTLPAFCFAFLGYFLWSNPFPDWLCPLEITIILCTVFFRYREINWISWISLVLLSYLVTNLFLDIDYSLNLESIDTWNEFAYMLMEISFLPVLSSWYVFEPAMILIEDKFSNRISYFVDRYFYFLGYGCALTLVRICANDRHDLALGVALIMILASYTSNLNKKLPKGFEGVPYRRRTQTIDAMDLAGDTLSSYLKTSK